MVVVEAGKMSGALITCSFALEQGREVFAVPGEAGSLNTKGTHGLIKQGAKLVETADDILEEFAAFDGSARRSSGEDKRLKDLLSAMDPKARKIYHLLSGSPMHIDDIADEFKIDPSSACLNLMELELKGLVKQLPGKLFVRA